MAAIDCFCYEIYPRTNDEGTEDHTNDDQALVVFLPDTAEWGEISKNGKIERV